MSKSNARLSRKLRRLAPELAHAIIDAVVSLPKGERIEVLRSAVHSQMAVRS